MQSAETVLEVLRERGRRVKPHPEWAQIMARRRRKTLVVCEGCYATIHPRRRTASITE
jgi:hypothetical protein